MNPDRLQCRCIASCTLPGNVKLTVHGGGVHTRMPILSESDKRQIAYFKDNAARVHFLNVSYCRTAGDVQEVQTFLKECAAASCSPLAGRSLLQAGENCTLSLPSRL